MKDFFKNLFIFLLGVGSLVYLIVESTVPFELPIVGNFDDTAAIMVLLSSLNYFGINLVEFFGKKRRK